MPEVMCAYGSCHDTDTPILVTLTHCDPRVKVRFCSFDHLIAWAAHRRDNRLSSDYSLPSDAAIQAWAREPK